MKHFIDTEDYRDINNTITTDMTFFQNKSWTEYRQDGQCHRDNGPAYTESDGRKEYWQYGKRHRDNGPAYIDKRSGYQAYFIDGKYHREDGPARIYPDGSTEYYNYGIKQS